MLLIVFIPMKLKIPQTFSRRVWRYQRGNQTP